VGVDGSRDAAVTGASLLGSVPSFDESRSVLISPATKGYSSIITARLALVYPRLLPLAVCTNEVVGFPPIRSGSSWSSRAAGVPLVTRLVGSRACRVVVKLDQQVGMLRLFDSRSLHTLLQLRPCTLLL
jgi:hypothetical protein